MKLPRFDYIILSTKPQVYLRTNLCGKLQIKYNKKVGKA